MADPICRWRNSSVKQVCEFNLLFPFQVTEKSKGRVIVEKNWALLDGKDFFTTPYQLAAQMAIYYEDNAFMYPRFNKRISLAEAETYIHHWGKRYYAPNPYTRSLKTDKKPVVMNNFLVNWAIEAGKNASFTDALILMFGNDIGNSDILTNMVNNYMEVNIVDGIVVLKDSEKKEKYPKDEVWLDFDSNDKKAFFDFFGGVDFNSSYEPKGNVNDLQVIYYGAPGTSKSHTVKEMVDDNKKIHFRTTFHPDSDYSTFVGCYKPRSHKKNLLSGNGINETQLLSCFFNSNGSEYKGKNKARYLYEALVHTKDIRDLGLDAQMVSDKLNAQGFTGCAYTTEATCMYNIYDWLKEDGYIVENKLTYEFTPQAFVNAYVEAWRQQKSGTPVYLIIEEINRGNCAQIFGDLFQLLDRDDKGFSRYEVTPDSDLQDYIASLGLNISDIVDRSGNDISSKISRGELLKLPDNFFIWATMNTSDQSLFPIDSAFKRRWDWKYMPIEDAGMNWEIHVNGNTYNWYDFLVAINKEVLTLTHSEDKQLGYFFAKAKNNIIDAETLVNKVFFYLWTDVFKDYDYESQKAFRKPNSTDPIAFKDFFIGRLVNEKMAEQVLVNLELNKPEENAE